MPITHPNPNIREKKDEHKGYCYPAAMEETAHDNVRDACTVGWWGADSNLAKNSKTASASAKFPQFELGENMTEFSSATFFGNHA
jgi:hypothetical protein